MIGLSRVLAICSNTWDPKPDVHVGDATIEFGVVDATYIKRRSVNGGSRGSQKDLELTPCKLSIGNRILSGGFE